MPATEVNRPDRHVVQRHAAVLVWVPVILGGLLLDLPAGAPAMAAVLALVVAGAVACVVAVIASWPRATPRSSLAVAILAAAVAAGSLAWSSWTPAWLLVAMSAAVALPTRASLVAVPASALASAWTLSRWGATRDELLAQAFVVLLAGAAAAAFSRLVSTADELRRTREELAEHAVARERERFSRDLHDTLGHTLSVVVVKAAVVRRLVPTDPAAAAQHAADIEQVARQAMAQLRDTVDGAVVPRLDDELRQAQAAWPRRASAPRCGPTRRRPRCGSPAGLGGARGGDERAAPLGGQRVPGRGDPRGRPGAADDHRRRARRPGGSRRGDGCRPRR